MKGFVYPLLGALLLSVPDPIFAGPEAVEIWRGRPVFRGSEGTLLDAPYVSSHDRIVQEMLDLVELRDGDVLYDLGCGDGRIVIEAVRRAWVRGVGIDLDRSRITESKANALAAKVGDRVTFLQQDFFQADIREATVVTLFLLTEINLRLRPKLFRELRPGTRIVSHNFGMGDWKADKEILLDLKGDGLHDLYVWILPTNVSGLWAGRQGGDSWRLFIRQRFQRIEGDLLINGKMASLLMEASIVGDSILFTAEKKDGESRLIAFRGKVKGDEMEGLFREPGKPDTFWKATRDPGTVSWIE